MRVIIILIMTLFSVSSFAQKSDTLIVPVGKYKFIKIGDRVYEIEITLKEVQKPIDLSPIWKYSQQGSLQFLKGSPQFLQGVQMHSMDQFYKSIQSNYNPLIAPGHIIEPCKSNSYGIIKINN